MNYQRPENLSRVRSRAVRSFALLLAALTTSLGGCVMWCDDGPCGPPCRCPGPRCPQPRPHEHVYVVPDGGATVVEEQPVYYYSPTPYMAYDAVYRGQAADDSASPSAASAQTVRAAYLTRGQDSAQTVAADSDYPVSDAFPVFDASDFPTADDSLPPEQSEIGDFAKKNGEVPEPTGHYETIEPDENFDPEPKRESLAEREKKEEKVEKNFDEWLRKKKAQRQAENKKTKRYLQPIPDSNCELFDREARKSGADENDGQMISTVTLSGLEMMLDNEDSKRELYDWEKDSPTPVDWSKYALTMDDVRSWFGMGPNERAALEYMRQACLKQKEYDKTHDKECLREAAKLYEKAASRWPGPALRPDYAKKHPYDAPKSGTLIEEDGIFYAGECWFFCREFTRALSCYKALVSTYTNSIYKDTAMKRLYYIGTYWMKCYEASSGPSVNVKDSDKPVFSTFAGADKAFSTIFLNDASDSGLADEALFALANAYMRRGRQQGDGSFETAARYYKQLYEFYPASEHAEDSCRLAMIALHKSYQGVFYDEAPLTEARELAETILKSGRGNMDVVYEELENIKDEQAHRLYALGGYYEKRGNYASSRNYYNRLVKEFPNSEYAVEGARRYEQIESKPAEVDQLAWVRPVMPFLPKSKNEYFEEIPSDQLSKIARREEKLDNIGKDVDDLDSKETKVAESPDAPKRY